MNDIRYPSGKIERRARSEASCLGFRKFIETMGMEEIVFQGNMCTWANNWEEEGYIERRLDRFFGTANWLLVYATALVHHVKRQASDHSLLILNTNPNQRRKKSRFHFDRRWVNKPRLEDVVRQAWATDCESSRMFQVASKIKLCRLGLLNWSRSQMSNAAVRIRTYRLKWKR